MDAMLSQLIKTTLIHWTNNANFSRLKLNSMDEQMWTSKSLKIHENKSKDNQNKYKDFIQKAYYLDNIIIFSIVTLLQSKRCPSFTVQLVYKRKIG